MALLRWTRTVWTGSREAHHCGAARRHEQSMLSCTPSMLEFASVAREEAARHVPGVSAEAAAPPFRILPCSGQHESFKQSGLAARYIQRTEHKDDQHFLLPFQLLRPQTILPNVRFTSIRESRTVDRGISCAQGAYLHLILTTYLRVAR